MPSPPDPSPEFPPRATTPARIALAAMTVARLTLGIGMLPYGISKLFGLQFQVAASRYARPLGDASGAILTWAFLGYSPVFQFLLGVFETIPAILLLFARTRRLGALLLLPAVLNVAMFNYFLDLWPSTQVISAVFLSLNVFLILYDYPIYLDLLSRLLASPAPIANRKLRIAARAAGFIVPVAVIVPFLINFHAKVATSLEPLTDFIGARQINRAGSWKIQSFQIAGEPMIALEGASLYFDFDRRCVYKNGVAASAGTFAAEKSLRTFRILCIPLAGTNMAIQGSYRADGDRLFLAGVEAGHPVSLVLRRDRWIESRRLKQ